MTKDDKAQLYDNYVREGDIIHRQISKLKSSINLTTTQEAEVGKLNQQLVVLEAKVNKLFTD